MCSWACALCKSRRYWQGEAFKCDFWNFQPVFLLLKFHACYKMGHINPSLHEECLISRENDKGNDDSITQSRDMSLKETNSGELPLSYFLELAEKQVSVEPVKKRMKTTTSAMGSNVSNVGSTMKHVADIVLVLAGLGLIRGGRETTDEERRLLAEAYGNLGFLVQQLDPRDLVSPSFAENLIEDFGLRRPKDQEVKTFTEILEGFQPPASSMPATVERAQIGTDADVMGLLDQDPVSGSRSTGANNDNDELPTDLPLPFEGAGQEIFIRQATEVPPGPFQIIHNLLQIRYPVDYKFQAAHPRTFMSAAMPCEICKLTARDTASVLACDTCDKVYHLRCLQSYLLMGIPKGDWHCPKCSNEGGREVQHAPVYGRVKAGFSFAKCDTIGGPAKSITTTKTRQADGHTPKKAQPAEALLTAAEKHREHVPSTNQLSQNVVVSGNLGGTFTTLLGSFAQGEDAGQSSMPKPSQISNNSEQSSLSQAQTTTRSSLSSLQAREPPLTRSSSHLLHGGKVAGRDKKATKSASSANGSKQSKFTDESEGYDDTSMGSDEAECDNPAKEADRFGIDWVGDMLYQHDDKCFYSACTVGGCLYKLQDCALFRPETPNVPPYIARLQALWEDANTGSKWVRVNWCYYPSDMAMITGRPPNPEVHEVYESNHGDNNLVGTIQGQCLVLQPESYLKEMERRQELLKSGTTGESLVPVFLCNWFYDVVSATFRPATQAP